MCLAAFPAHNRGLKPITGDYRWENLTPLSTWVHLSLLNGAPKISCANCALLFKSEVAKKSGLGQEVCEPLHVEKVFLSVLWMKLMHCTELWLDWARVQHEVKHSDVRCKQNMEYCLWIPSWREFCFIENLRTSLLAFFIRQKKKNSNLKFARKENGPDLGWSACWASPEVIVNSSLIYWEAWSLETDFPAAHYAAGIGPDERENQTSFNNCLAGRVSQGLSAQNQMISTKQFNSDDGTNSSRKEIRIFSDLQNHRAKRLVGIFSCIIHNNGPPAIIWMILCF